MNWPRVGPISVELLYSRCFFIVPTLAEVIEQVGLSREFWSGSPEAPYLQFCVPERGSYLATVVTTGSDGLPISCLAGTSSNHTGTGSIPDRNSAAVFCLRHEIFWHDDEPEADPSRVGSYAVVSIEEGACALGARRKLSLR